MSWKHPSRQQRRRTDAEGWPASGCLPVAMATEQTTSCVMSCRISAAIAKSSGGLGSVSVTQPVGMNPTYRFSFISTPPPSALSSCTIKSHQHKTEICAAICNQLFSLRRFFLFFLPPQIKQTRQTQWTWLPSLSNKLIIVNCTRRHDRFVPLIINSFSCQIFHFWERRGSDARVPAPPRDLLVNSEPLFRQA